MGWLLLFGLVGLGALFSILLDRRWQRRAWLRHQPPGSAQRPDWAATPQDNPLVAQIIGGWQKRLGWHTSPVQDQTKLRTWLVTHLAEEPTTQAWVAALTPAEFAALHQELAAFCQARQIDLAWLGEQALVRDPALAATVQAVVLHYIQAQQQAVTALAELQAFQTYLALAQRPYSYEYQPLVQQLYTQVVKAGLADPARPEALLATEKLRIEHMLRAIQTAAATDRRAFYRLVNTLHSPAPPTETTAAPTDAPQPLPATKS